MSALRNPIFINKHVTSGTITTPGSSHVHTFHRHLDGYRATPLICLPEIASALGVQAVYIKDESNRLNLPSFKILGASWGTFYAVARHLSLPLDVPVEELASRAREAGLRIFAATDGNHGRAVAHMAKLISLPAHIYVSETLDRHTKQLIIDEGATLIEDPGDYDAVVQVACKAAHEMDGGIFVQDTSFPSYEDIPAKIVEGYSTMFKEIDEQLAELGSAADLVITPVGVGSLAHAVVQHYKGTERTKPTKVATVEPDTAACLYRSLITGSCSKIKTSHTIMSGLDCGTVSHTAWPDLQAHVDASCTVSDYEAHNAVKSLREHGISSGPCGAAGLAALRRFALESPDVLGARMNSVIVLLNTEGARPYEDPNNETRDVTIE